MVTSNYNSIFLETRFYINNVELFDEFAENYYSACNQDLFRLSKWFDFFLNNYFKAPCIFSSTIFALFEANNNNLLFKNQTEHEFAICLSFYDKIINTPFLLVIEETKVAYHLLSIALIFSKYPGMQIRSTFKAIEKLSTGVNPYTLGKFFETLFVKFESPVIFTNNIPYLSMLEIDMLMFFLQGNNIRNYQNTTYTLSKKESYYFIHKIPKTITFNENVFVKGVALTRLLLIYDDSKFLHSFLFACKEFQFNIDTFMNNIVFWKDVYRFLAKINWDESRLSIQEYVDYFEYINNKNNSYSLKGRTVKSVTNAINEWHAYYTINEWDHYTIYVNDRFKDISWKGSGIKEIRITYKEKDYLFIELRNSEVLYKEIAEMAHCVFSYLSACINGMCTIFSMKKKINGFFVPHLTIKVQNKRIVQVTGKNNLKPKKSDLIIIDKWSKEAGFSDGYCTDLFE